MLVAALGAWAALRPEPYVVPDGLGASGGPARPQPTLAARTLESLVRALGSGDADAAAAVGDDSSAALLRAVAANAAALQVSGLGLRYVDEVGAVAADGTWQAAVDATWSFSGFDPRPVREEVVVRFRAAGNRVVVTGLGGSDRRTPLWLTGPLEVRRSPRTLVAVAGTAAAADTYAEQAEQAVRVVRRVLPDYPGGLVVEVPSTTDALDAALGADPGDYAAAAAVTASVDGTLTPGSPVHVFVNPTVFDTLDPVGAQVVLSHEATHEATDAPLHVLPIWLLEGFADYVALRDVDLPITTTAGQVIAEVEARGLPEALPDEADFDEKADTFGASYEAAWLACRVVAATAGEQALVGLYEQVSDGAEIGPALRATTGRGVEGLTRAWRARLAALAA